MTMSESNDEDATYLYTLCLKISHPTIDPRTVTEQLGLQPTGGWEVGDEARARNGAPLGRPRKESYWYYVLRVEHDRDFFSGLMEFVERSIEPHAGFIKTLVAGGGEVMILVHLPGSHNIGSDLIPRELIKLGALGVQVGVEVFPGMT